VDSTTRKIEVVADADEIARRAAEEFVTSAEAAVRERGRFTVALSGGSTPRRLYRLLTDNEKPFRARVPWQKCDFFFGDERHVAPDHPNSNYRMAQEAMFSKISIPPENVHRIKSENPDARKAAEEYEQELRAFCRLARGQLPRFDLVFLGMGPDGHTASLFPGTDALREETRLVAAPRVEKLSTYRVTLMPPVLNNASCTIFLVAGADKAETLRAVLQGSYQPDLYPAQLVRPAVGKVLWLVDKAAASLMSSV